MPLHDGGLGPDFPCTVLQDSDVHDAANVDNWNTPFVQPFVRPVCCPSTAGFPMHRGFSPKCATSDNKHSPRFPASSDMLLDSLHACSTLSSTIATRDGMASAQQCSSASQQGSSPEQLRLPRSASGPLGTEGPAAGDPPPAFAAANGIHRATSHVHSFHGDDAPGHAGMAASGALSRASLTATSRGEDVYRGKAVAAMVALASEGVLSHEPEITREGMGGTYFLRHPDGDKVAVFKPCDEEPWAPNNPKGWVKGDEMGAPGFKHGIRVGEAAFREVAAYLLDHDGFAGVPAACMVQCSHEAFSCKVDVPRHEPKPVGLPLPLGPSFRPPTLTNAPTEASLSMHSDASATGGLSEAIAAFSTLTLPSAAPSAQPSTGSPSEPPASFSPCRRWAPTSVIIGSPRGPLKLGSLQSFVQHKCTAEDLGPSNFSPDNVHRIGVLDLRLLNTDRHVGNLLAAPKPKHQAADHLAANFVLVPIDHGYSLPDALPDTQDLELDWMQWPQARMPFSEEVREYVAKLDGRAEGIMLAEHLPGIRLESLRCLELATMLLQKCVAAGLTLYEIGSIVMRSDPLSEQHSDLEVMAVDARAEVLGVRPEASSQSISRSSSSHLAAADGDTCDVFGGGGLSMPLSSSLYCASECGSPRGGAAALALCRQEKSGTLQKLDEANDEGGAADDDSDADSACLPELPPQLEEEDSEALTVTLGAGPEQASPCMLGPVATGSQSYLHAASESPECPSSPASPWHGGDPCFGEDDSEGERALGGSSPLSSPGCSVCTPCGPSLGAFMGQQPCDRVVDLRCQSAMLGNATARPGVRPQRRLAWRSKVEMVHGGRGSGAMDELLRELQLDQNLRVFDGLSEMQWRAFMDQMGSYVDVELAAGTWSTKCLDDQRLACTAPAGRNFMA